MPLDPVALAREIAGGIDEDDTRESPQSIARSVLGLPEEEEEGLDIMQPIRSFFGASEGVGGYGLGQVLPESYKEAAAEKKVDFGITDEDPIYEKAEALPGGGDVLAQLVPDPIRESLVGRAVGPVARMVGNIAFDPTTYTPAVAAKAARGVIAGVKGGNAMFKAAQAADKSRKAAVAAGTLTREASRAAHMQDASRIADLVLKEGTPMQVRAYKAGIGAAAGGDLAMGAAAALAYGPEVVGATIEGVRRTAAAEGAGETAAEAANAALMAGLTALMGKGAIDAATATRAYTRHLKDTKQIPKDVERVEKGLAEEAGVEDGMLPPREEGGMAMLEDEVPPVEPEITERDLDAVPAEPLPGVPGEGRVAQVRPEEFVPPVVDTLPEADIIPETPEVLPEGREAGTPRTPEVAPAEVVSVTPDPETIPPDTPVKPDVVQDVEPPKVTEEPPPVSEPSTEPAAPKPEPEAVGAPPEPSIEPPAAPIRPEPSKPPVEPVKAPEPPSEGPKAPEATDEIMSELGGRGMKVASEGDDWIVRDAEGNEVARGATLGEATVAASQKLKEPPKEGPKPEPEAEPTTDTRVEDIPREVTDAIKDEEFAKILTSEVGRDNTRRAAGKVTPAQEAGGMLTDRILEGMTNNAEFQKEFLAARKALGPNPTGKQLFGAARKIANKKKGDTYVYGIKGARLGAGGASFGPGALDTATETAEAAGKPVGETKKQKARAVGAAGRLDRIKDKLKDDGVDFHDFTFASGTFQSLNKQNRDLFVEYLAHMEKKGMTRVKAIKLVQEAHKNQLAARTVSRLIGEPEIKLEQEVAGKKREKASPEQIKQIRQLQKEAKDFPKPGTNQTTEEFANALRADNKEVGLALGRFLRFVVKRDQTQLGLPASVRSIKPLKDFAKSIGVEVAPVDDAIKLAARIANHVGLDPQDLRKRIQQLEADAAGRTRKGPFKLEGFTGSRDGSTWTHPNGMKIRTLRPLGDNYLLQIEKHPKELDKIVETLRPLLKNDRVDAFDISDAKPIVQEAMDELGLVQIPAEKMAGDDFRGDPADFVFYGAPDRVDSMASRMEEIVRGYIPHEISNAHSREVISEAIDSQAFAIKLREQLKGRVKGIDFDKLVETDFKEGTYHQVFKLNGAYTPDGNGVMLRVGRAPSHAYPTTMQQSLMIPTLAKGKLADDPGRGAVGPYRRGEPGMRKSNRPIQPGPIYYTVHPEAAVAGYLDNLVGRYDKSRLLTESPPIAKSLEATELRNDYSEFIANRAAMEHALTLPPGMGLQDNLDAISDLFSDARRAGLMIQDVTHGPGSIRFDQWGWIPMKKADVTPETIAFHDLNGNSWRLVFTDYGTVFPNPETRAGTIWQFLDEHPDADTVRLSLKALEPESRLSMRDKLARQSDYEDDLAQGVDLGDGLKNVNNDRIASDEFVARHGELGGGAARALKRVVADLQTVINKDDAALMADDMNVEYAGLTNSPHLSGLHLESTKGKGRILSNVVEAVNSSSSYDDAIDQLLHTVTHEVSHNKNKGHDANFQLFHEYVDRLNAAEGRMDQYRAWLKESFTEDQYKAIRSELAPQFKRMRKEHGGRESWRQASIEGLPVGTAQGGATPRTYRSGRGAEAASRGIADGVRPRSALQRGGRGETGRVREAAIGDGPDAKGRAQAEATGSDARRGTEGAQAEYERLVEQVDEFWSREEGGPKDVEQTKALLDEFVNLQKKSGRPLSDLHTTAWELAEALHAKLSQDEKDQLRNALPSPRKKGQMKGVFNMLHNPDISDELKEITTLYGQIADGAWAKDTPRKWEDVGVEVKELLGIDTPENWTLAFRNKGGGITDRDALMLRQIHTELANKIDHQKDRFADAVAKGEEAQIAQTMKDVHASKERYMMAGLNLSRAMTGAGRALAIGRHTVRKGDPRAQWEASLKAGLREKMRSRFKDPQVAEEKAGILYNKMMEIVDKGDEGDWGEFYRAYRAMTRTKLWPDKVLEWYKAGLLGWSSRAANITSNGLFRAVRYVEDGVAGAMDASASKLTGNKREIYAGEAGVSMLALRRATAEAFPKWIQANQRAFTLKPQDFSKAVASGSIMEDLLMHPGAIEGKFGELVRFQLKGLGADDEFAKTLSRTDTYYREVYRRLRNGEFKQDSGESYVQATERIVNDLRMNFKEALDGHPHDTAKLKLWEPIAEQADVVAKRDTFQEDLGNAGRGFQSWLRENPAGQIFFPFVRTPTNIAKETIKRTPAGFAILARNWKDLTPAQRMTELSKPMTGTAMGAGIMALAMTGEITGGGPVDWNEKQMMIDAGWAPYSIRIGDQWISYQRFEPIAAIFGIAADAAEGVRNGDFDSWNAGTLKVLQSTAENITNKTFMSGMDALFSAISDPKRSLGSLEKQLQGSIIPNSLGFIPVGRLARGIDATYRQTEPMTMDVFYAKIPFLSKTVTPQYTPTGEERKRPGSAIERVLSPFARRTVEDGVTAAGAEEVVRVGATPQPPKKYWYGKGGVRVPFLREEKQLFAKALGKATEVIGTKLIKDPNYLRLPDDEMDPRYIYGRKTKQDVIRNIYRKYRAAAMKQIRKDVDLRARQTVKENRAGG